MKEWVCNSNFRTGFTEGLAYRESSNGKLVDDDGAERLEAFIYNINRPGSFTLREPPVLENK